VQKTYLLFISLLIPAMIVAGCTGNLGNSGKNLIVHDNITTAIETSWYLHEHHTTLDPSSIKLVNVTSYGIETADSIQFKTTDGVVHTGTLYLDDNNSSSVRIMEIDGEYPE
jgi:hypothetical protein